jgi:hypothetical protein
MVAISTMRVPVPICTSLCDCQTDPTVLHGLVQAMDELDGSTTLQAFQGRGALMVAIERMAGKLANDLDDVKEAKA